MSNSAHYSSFWRQNFTGCMTQPTAS